MTNFDCRLPLFTAASRVGQGHYGLSSLIRQMRYKKLLLLNDEEVGNDTDEDEGLGLHAETSRASLGSKSAKNLRDSWYASFACISLRASRTSHSHCVAPVNDRDVLTRMVDLRRSWSQPGTPAPQTPSGTRRRRGGQSAVEIGRRWEALVGRMMAVTAWQKSRVVLLALHKTLQFSEVMPWLAEDAVHLMDDPC